MMKKKLSKKPVIMPEEVNTKQRNKNILLVTYIFLGLFLILAVYFAYLAGYSSKDKMNNSYNKLQNLLSKSVVRGDIYSSDGKLLATTKRNDKGEEYRSYPFDMEYCHVVGSIDQGLYGLEAAYNFDLLSSSTGMFTKIANDLSGKKDQGDSIVTTLDSTVQDAAYRALGNYDGAVIVMDNRTGAVKAMVSSPGYNPNTVAQEWETIQSGTSSVLLNRATQGLYTPGSIFKLVTLYEYLREGGDEEGYSYHCTGSTKVKEETISCNNRIAHGTVNLMDSFAYSCNCSFMNIGNQISVKSLKKTCEELLFGEALPIKIEYKKSSFSLKEEDSEFMKAQTMFGQGETLMSPVHAAILVSAVANEGTAMEPRFVECRKNASGKCVKTFSKKSYKTLFEPEMAEKLKEYMHSVTEYGTAERLNGYGHLTVYGKTGSAEIDSERNINSWFIGFAENEEKGESYTIVAVAEKVADGTAPAPAVTITNQILKVLD